MQRLEIEREKLLSFKNQEPQNVDKASLLIMQHMQQNILQSQNYLKLIMISNFSLVARYKKLFSAFAKFLEISPFLVSKVSSLLDAVIIFSKGSPDILKEC